MRKLISTAGVMILAVASASCGGPNEDGVKALMAFGNPGTARILREVIREAHARAHQKADEVKARAELAGRLKDFSVLSGLQRDLNITDGHCTENTPSTSTHFDLGCSWTFSGDTADCAGTTYTYTNGTGTLDFGMEITAPTASITAAIGIDSSVSGGEIEGTINIDCTLAFAMTMNTTTGDVTFGVSGCGGFACSIDGDDVDCEDMQDAVSETSC